MSRLPTTAPPRSHARRGNAVLAAPAARAATLIAPGSCLPQCASVPGPRRWSVGGCSYVGETGQVFPGAASCSLDGAQRNPGPRSNLLIYKSPARLAPDSATLHPGYGEVAANSCPISGAWEPESGWDCTGPSRHSRSHALRGNAVLAAPAARAATRRWSVGACSHAGALEPEEIAPNCRPIYGAFEPGRRWERGA